MADGMMTSDVMQPESEFVTSKGRPLGRSHVRKYQKSRRPAYSPQSYSLRSEQRFVRDRRREYDDELRQLKISLPMSLRVILQRLINAEWQLHRWEIAARKGPLEGWQTRLVNDYERRIPEYMKTLGLAGGGGHSSAPAGWGGKRKTA